MEHGRWDENTNWPDVSQWDNVTKVSEALKAEVML
jgi:hypothetical protein